MLEEVPHRRYLLCVRYLCCPRSALASLWQNLALGPLILATFRTNRKHTAWKAPAHSFHTAFPKFSFFSCICHNTVWYGDTIGSMAVTDFTHWIWRHENYGCSGAKQLKTCLTLHVRAYTEANSSALCWIKAKYTKNNVTLNARMWWTWRFCFSIHSGCTRSAKLSSTSSQLYTQCHSKTCLIMQWGTVKEEPQEIVVNTTKTNLYRYWNEGRTLCWKNLHTHTS